MLKYLNDVFVKTKKWMHFINNYAHKIFGDMGFFYDDENKPLPDYFIIASLLDIIAYAPADSEYELGTFKEKFLEFTNNENLFCRIVGINWKSRKSNDHDLPQKNNNFQNFIPENLDGDENEFFKFKSIGKYNLFFKIHNFYSSVITEDYKKNILVS